MINNYNTICLVVLLPRQSVVTPVILYAVFEIFTAVVYCHSLSYRVAIPSSITDWLAVEMCIFISVSFTVIFCWVALRS